MATLKLPDGSVKDAPAGATRADRRGYRSGRVSRDAAKADANVDSIANCLTANIHRSSRKDPDA